MADGKKIKDPFRNRADRIDRERKQLNYVRYGTLFIVISVIALVLFGVVYEKILLPNQSIATVNGEILSTGSYQARVRYQRSQLVSQWNQTYTNVQYFPDNPEILAQIQSQLGIIQAQLEPSIIGQQLLDQMIDEILFKQEAIKLGITVDQEEIDQAIYTFFSFFPVGTPTIQSVNTPFPTSTLSATQYALVTITPTPSITPTVTLIPDIVGTSALEESESTTTPEVGGEEDPILAGPPSPTSVPTSALPTLTPTAYSTEIFSTNYQTFFEIQADQNSLREEDLHWLAENQLYARKLSEFITKDVAEQEDQVWARHILVDTEDTADEVYEKLLDGQDWTALVEEYSIDVNTSLIGGDLGWFNNQSKPVQYTEEFLEAAFTTEIGEFTEIINTPEGWHIIQVLGHEIRSLTNNELALLKNEVFLEWAAQLREGAEINIEDKWESKIPTEPVVPDLSTLPAFQQPIAEPSPTP